MMIFGIKKSMHTFTYDCHCDDDQYDCVGESSQGLDPTVSVGKTRVRIPRAYEGRDQTDHQSGAIEKHMPSIGKKSERICQKTGRNFYERERKVDDQK